MALHLCGLIARAAPGLGRETLRLIDATRIHAGQTVREWAVDGARKLHVVLEPVHTALCINYLKATGLHLCLLLNFGRPRLEIHRVAHEL